MNDLKQLIGRFEESSRSLNSLTTACETFYSVLENFNDKIDKVSIRENLTALIPKIQSKLEYIEKVYKQIGETISEVDSFFRENRHLSQKYQEDT